MLEQSSCDLSYERFLNLDPATIAHFQLLGCMRVRRSCCRIHVVYARMRRYGKYVPLQKIGLHCWSIYAQSEYLAVRIRLKYFFSFVLAIDSSFLSKPPWHALYEALSCLCLNSLYVMNPKMTKNPFHLVS